MKSIKRSYFMKPWQAGLRIHCAGFARCVTIQHLDHVSAQQVLTRYAAGEACASYFTRCMAEFM